MSGRIVLEPKLTGETKTYQFDFSSLLSAGVTISTQSVTASVYSGTDASPSGIISGSATAAGTIVSQKLTAGTAGVTYLLLCQITTSDSQTLQISAFLTVMSNII